MVWAFADVVKVATKRKKEPGADELRRARDCPPAGSLKASGYHH
jgi:hypothetical protein